MVLPKFVTYYVTLKHHKPEDCDFKYKSTLSAFVIPLYVESLLVQVQQWNKTAITKCQVGNTTHLLRLYGNVPELTSKYQHKEVCHFNVLNYYALFN
jgi:hypothetical protein